MPEITTLGIEGRDERGVKCEMAAIMLIFNLSAANLVIIFGEVTLKNDLRHFNLLFNRFSKIEIGNIELKKKKKTI